MEVWLALMVVITGCEGQYDFETERFARGAAPRPDTDTDTDTGADAECEPG